MASFPVPAVTLPPGSHVFGLLDAAGAGTSVTVTIDRTVPGGLNSLTPDSQVLVIAEASADGGITWHAVDTDQPGTVTSWSAIGGPQAFTDRQGTRHVYAISSGTWHLFPGAGRLVRATITVTGTPIAVAGSIVTQ